MIFVFFISIFVSKSIKSSFYLYSIMIISLKESDFYALNLINMSINFILNFDKNPISIKYHL